MPKAHNPRRGSMQVWPRKRAKRAYPIINSWAKGNGMLGFAGYKAGMTHLQVIEGGKNSPRKGMEVSVPATIIECPPIKVIGVRFYKKAYHGKQPLTEVWAKPSKDLARKLKVSKKDPKSVDSVNADDVSDVTFLVHTQPRLAGFGKKKPEVFEMGVGGDTATKLAFAKENLGKELSVKDVFKEGQFIDVHAVTTGKGTQGPVKRMGVKIRAAKAEKTKRGPGSLGGWVSQMHTMYRMAFAGQMGYHNRVDYNKKILKIGDDPKEVNPKGGLVHYGEVKSTFLLVKGSIPGPKKRLVRLKIALRPDNKKEEVAPTIEHISTTSQQRR